MCGRGSVAAASALSSGPPAHRALADGVYVGGSRARHVAEQHGGVSQSSPFIWFYGFAAARGQRQRNEKKDVPDHGANTMLMFVKFVWSGGLRFWDIGPLVKSTYPFGPGEF